jgi:hypothetical protein
LRAEGGGGWWLWRIFYAIGQNLQFGHLPMDKLNTVEILKEIKIGPDFS